MISILLKQIHLNNKFLIVHITHGQPIFVEWKFQKCFFLVTTLKLKNGVRKNLWKEPKDTEATS